MPTTNSGPLLPHERTFMRQPPIIAPSSATRVSSSVSTIRVKQAAFGRSSGLQMTGTPLLGEKPAVDDELGAGDER